MKSENIKQIVETVEELDTSNGELLKTISDFIDSDGSPFDISAQFVGADSSFSEVQTQITTIIELIGKFDNSVKPFLVPAADITKLRSSIDNLKQAVDALRSYIENNVNSHDGLSSFEYSNFHGMMKNGNNINYQSQFNALTSNIESLLPVFCRVLTILKPVKSTYSFNAAGNAFQVLLERLNREYSDISQSSESLERQVGQAKSALDQVEENKDKISNIGGQISDEESKLAQLLTDINTKSTEIDEVHMQANSLKSSVESYQTDFNEFDAQLKSRGEKFEYGQIKLDALIEDLKQEQSKISELNSRAEEMLSSATVAGLAENFEKIRTDLTHELESARPCGRIDSCIVFGVPNNIT